MPFSYSKVLVLGATSGIGEALAHRMVSNGVKVIAVGRRQDRLDEFASKYTKEQVSTAKFDISDLEGIPSFAKEITSSHPDLDCVYINSGIQRAMDFSKPETIDLKAVDSEITTNYTSNIHLLKYFLPHLIASKKETAVILTTSGLAYVPMLRCGNYCATKAAIHHLALVVREQLRQTNVKIIELIPPAVQTELHDAKHQPDIVDGHKIGMPLNEFTDEAWQGLQDGHEDVMVGFAKGMVSKVEPGRRSAFEGMLRR